MNLTNLSKPFFNPITGTPFLFSAVRFAFAWPPLNLHVSEVPKDSRRKCHVSHSKITLSQ